MWLIETESLKLEYFVGNNIPAYAILSHPWGDGEVTFQDWQDFPKASQKTGFAKIKSACAQARADSHDYIWVDTNCIDKSSSAELSEAINRVRDSRGKDVLAATAVYSAVLVVFIGTSLSSPSSLTPAANA
jgi:hypothetical protein